MSVPNIKSVISIFLVVYLSVTSHAFAQNEVSTPNSGSSGKITSTEEAAAELPDPVTMNLLIRSTLIALNNANMAGNYSVLRDLGAPAFQQLNSAASLAEQFQILRKSQIDFAPIFYFHPNLTSNPKIESDRFLLLKGYMPTDPIKINFDLAFQKIKAKWLLLSIRVDTSKMDSKVSQNSQETDPAHTGTIAGHTTSNSVSESNTGKSANSIPQDAEPKNSIRINLEELGVPSRSPNR
jgi:hypothetical protein